MADAFFRRIALSRPGGVREMLAVVLICALAGLGVRLALGPVFGGFPGYVILIPPVALATLRAGSVAGFWTMLFCLVGNLAITRAVPGLIPFDPTLMAIGAGAYVVVACFIAFFAASLRGTLRDLERTMTALPESEARFRLMADTAPSPVWMTNAEAEVEFVNAALVEHYGRPAHEILGHVWKQAVHPDDQAAVEAAMAAARPQRLPYGFEARFRHADGGWRWMRISVNPRFDADRAFLGYVGMAFDVSQTRELLNALAVQERRQTFLLDLSDRLRELMTPDDIVAEVNRSVAKEIGADWASYGEVDEALETIAIRAASPRPARDDVSAVWRLDDFGPRLVASLKRGEMARVDDIATHPDTAAVAQAFKSIDAAAVLGAPVLRNGRMRALFLVHASSPHVWTDDEAALVEDVATRAWAEVERARAVAGVRETNARLAAAGAEREAILGQLAEGVIVTDPKGAITFVNDAARRQHGVARLGIAPEDYSDAYQLFTDDGRPYPPEDLPLSRAVLRGETVTDARWRIRRPDGAEVIAVGNARPVIGPDGVRIGSVLTLRDETARINAEHHLIESEARFRTVADSAPVFIWMTDPDTRIIFANRRYQTVFGTDTGELMGARWKKLAHPDDVEPFSLAFLNAMKTNDRFEALLRIDHPDLGLRWLRCESIPRFDAAGVFQGYVGASIDVTDAKQAEEDLKRINELLEERVGEALAEKARAEADLMHAQRMEAVGRLTGGVAHDFNNLLTVVIGALDMILRSPDDAARRKKLGEAALSAARRGERLTHQLLAFSRRQALRPEPVDLNTQIRESEPLLRRAVGEAIEFRLKLRRGGARVSVDPAQFEAALLNLIVNARDAVAGKVGKGVGRIAVQTRSCEIAPGDVLELAPGDYICITVSDNGTGMDPATLNRVFEPFFTTKAVGKGTGLGLSQVYGFARQSGGGVHISSTPGRGSEIRLYLPPLNLAEPAAPDAARVEIEAIPAGRRLLLVEDDAGVAAVAMELLQGLGLEVDAVESGPEALQALTGARFDVMLTDVVMPGGMTGIELARVCAERHPDLRILLTSGYAGEDVDEALADAPWPFLRKPYSADQLRQALGTLLPLESHP